MYKINASIFKSMVPHYIHSLLPTAMLVFLPAAARALFVPTDLAAFFIRHHFLHPLFIEADAHLCEFFSCRIEKLCCLWASRRYHQDLRKALRPARGMEQVVRRIVPVGLQVAEVVHVPVVQVLAHTGSAFSNTCYSYALSLSQSVSASYKNDSVLIYILQLLNKILTYLLSS